MNRPTRVALAAAAIAALTATPAAMAQLSNVWFDPAVMVGGLPWTGSTGATAHFTAWFASGTGRAELRVGGRYAGSSDVFGAGGESSYTWSSLADGAYTARIHLESQHICNGWSCSWSAGYLPSADFRVDRTPPSEPSIISSGQPQPSSTAITWSRSTDGGVGIDGYQLLLDGTTQAQLAGSECGGDCSASLDASLLPDGPHTVVVRVTDLLGNAIDSPPAQITVADTPSVALVNPPRYVIAGRPVDITARGTIPNGSPLSYAWDTDGNGTYDTDTGAAAKLRFSPSKDVTLRVRATAPGGGVATDSAAIDLRTAPPRDEPGVTLNDGDRFTRDANVTLSLSWPDGATGMKIATDGGFKGATTVPIAPTATVQLTGDDNTLLPHVVYVRFSGAGIDARETYTDDIILDTTPPVIEKASAERVGAKAVRVSTRVRDAVSGPQRLQVARSVSAQGTTVAYAPAVRAAVKGRKVAVRVADGAGNWSKWKTVAARGG